MPAPRFSPLQARTTLSSVKAGMLQEPSPDFQELVHRGLVEVLGKEGIAVRAKLTQAGEDYLASLHD